MLCKSVALSSISLLVVLCMFIRSMCPHPKEHYSWAKCEDLGIKVEECVNKNEGVHSWPLFEHVSNFAATCCDLSVGRWYFVLPVS